MIKLTAIEAHLKEEVIEVLNSTRPDEYDAEYYENLGIPVPDDLNQETEYRLTDDDYEEVLSTCYVEPTEIALMLDNSDVGCSLYLKSGHNIKVKETSEEVYKILAGLNKK